MARKPTTAIIVPPEILAGTPKEAAAYIDGVARARRGSAEIAKQLDDDIIKEALSLSEIGKQLADMPSNYLSALSEGKPWAVGATGAGLGGILAAAREARRRKKYRNWLNVLLGAGVGGAAGYGGSALLNKVVPAMGEAFADKKPPEAGAPPDAKPDATPDATPDAKPGADLAEGDNPNVVPDARPKPKDEYPITPDADVDEGIIPGDGGLPHVPGDFGPQSLTQTPTAPEEGPPGPPTTFVAGTDESGGAISVPEGDPKADDPFGSGDDVGADVGDGTDTDYDPEPQPLPPPLVSDAHIPGMSEEEVADLVERAKTDPVARAALGYLRFQQAVPRQALAFAEATFSTGVSAGRDLMGLPPSDQGPPRNWSVRDLEKEFSDNNTLLIWETLGAEGIAMYMGKKITGEVGFRDVWDMTAGTVRGTARAGTRLAGTTLREAFNTARRADSALDKRLVEAFRDFDLGRPGAQTSLLMQEIFAAGGTGIDANLPGSDQLPITQIAENRSRIVEALQENFTYKDYEISLAEPGGRNPATRDGYDALIRSKTNTLMASSPNAIARVYQGLARVPVVGKWIQKARVRALNRVAAHTIEQLPPGTTLDTVIPPDAAGNRVALEAAGTPVPGKRTLWDRVFGREPGDLGNRPVPVEHMPELPELEATRERLQRAETDLGDEHQRARITEMDEVAAAAAAREEAGAELKRERVRQQERIRQIDKAQTASADEALKRRAGLDKPGRQGGRVRPELDADSHQRYRPVAEPAHRADRRGPTPEPPAERAARETFETALAEQKRLADLAIEQQRIRETAAAEARRRTAEAVAAETAAQPRRRGSVQDNLGPVTPAEIEAAAARILRENPNLGDPNRAVAQQAADIEGGRAPGRPLTPAQAAAERARQNRARRRATKVDTNAPIVPPTTDPLIRRMRARRAAGRLAQFGLPLLPAVADSLSRSYGKDY